MGFILWFSAVWYSSVWWWHHFYEWRFIGNLWCIKTILRGFEIVYGLKVNFFKSNFFGINLDERFLEATSPFLSYGFGLVSFKFFGLSVGINPRHYSTWLPVIDNMRKQLSSWKMRHLSGGGRVILINSVLSSISIFYLSFFKAPKRVINEFISIQRNFLWGGSSKENMLG